MRPEVRSDLPAHHARLLSARDALSSSRTSNSLVLAARTYARWGY
jgi:hypothetical protein